MKRPFSVGENQQKDLIDVCHNFSAVGQVFTRTSLFLPVFYEYSSPGDLSLILSSERHQSMCLLMVAVCLFGTVHDWGGGGGGGGGSSTYVIDRNYLFLKSF